VEYFLAGLAYSIDFLQLGSVVLLLCGPVQKYAFVLGYCSLQVCTSLLETVASRKFGRGSWQYRRAFWTDEIALDVLLFFILILLTYRAMEGSPARGAMGRMLGWVTLIVMVLPFVLFKGAFVKTPWFDHTSQLLNFGGAILNLGLWTALLSSRKKDLQLLTVSAGFGVVATGAAVCFGLRRLIGHDGAKAANLVFLLAHLAGALMLCWAFLPRGRRTASGASRFRNVSSGALVP
jgi:hypothetical protein